MQLLSKMDPDKEIAWVTENEDELAKSMETVHSFRKSTAFIAWARRAGYQMPATATNLSPIEELRHLAVGALVRGATVHTSPSSASITTNVEVMTMLKELMAKVDKCNALQTRINDLEQSQQFLSGAFEDLKESNKQKAEPNKALQRQLAVQAKPPPAPAAEQDAIVISGMEESETGTESIERVSEIIHDTMELPSVTVVSAVRLGKQPAAEGRPRKLLVKLGSQKQAMEVLTSARRLSQLNNERKANSEGPIGIDRDLSPTELQHRSSVWAASRAAKAAKMECCWKLGYRLYVDGSEVLPGTSA